MFFDGVFDDETDYGYIAGLAYAMGSVFGLFIVVGVETSIENDDHIRTRQVNPKPAYPRQKQA
jgi:hypothetical protein